MANAFPGSSVVPGSEFTVTVNPPLAATLTTVFSIGGDRFAGRFQPGYVPDLISEGRCRRQLPRHEDFFVIVSQDDAPPTNLLCNTNVNATLNGDCQRFITAGHGAGRRFRLCQ